jgi:aspartate aminotransferase
MSWISERARNAAPSPTLAIIAKAKALQAQGVDVIGFGAGEPDFDTPDHIKAAAIAALNAGQTKYTPSAGTPALREAVCGKLQRENGLSYKPSQIIVSAGAKHSLYNLFQAILDEGDEVIVPVPYWVSYPEQVKLADGVPVLVDAPESNGFRVTAEAIAAAITSKTKAIVLNSPSNPSGAVVEVEELKKIAALAVEKNVLVISDEIYEHLTYGLDHVSIASFGPEIQALTLVVNGFSKAYSMTGWRLGWLAGDAEIVAAMGRIQDQSTSNPTSFAQAGAVAALQEPQDCVETMRQAFEQRRDYIVDRLNAIEGVSCVKPDGAFYALPNISGLTSSRYPDGDAVTEYLLNEARIAVVPGSGFGVPQHIRMSYATGMTAIEKGIDRLAAAAAELRALR